MNILISNDDGIESPALKPLVSRLVKNHNVLIVVPDGNRSGFSHSLSFYKNLTILKRNDICGAQTYTVSGTPADCVKFASHVLTDFKTDFHYRRKLTRPIDELGKKIASYYARDLVFYQDNEVGNIVENYLEFCTM